jgi:hypothetical protein
MFDAMHMASLLTILVVVVAVVALVALSLLSPNTTCNALAHKATLVVCCRRCCVVVVAITQRNVLQNEVRAPAHEGLVDEKCCCCSRVVILVAIAQCNMIVLRVCTQGLVVCWCFYAMRY